MSVVTVKKIQADGTVVDHAEIPNSMAGAMIVWSILDRKYGFVREGDYEALGRIVMSCKHPCWDALTHGEMSDRDCLVCAFTCDGCYIARENLTQLADALDSFFSEHLPQGVPTLPGIAAALRDVATDETARGACAWQTSTVADPWVVRCGDDDERPFVFGSDEKDRNGKEPWELFGDFGPDAIAERRASKPVA